MESLSAIPMPLKEAMFFASGAGLGIGAMMALMDIGTAFVQKKLHIKDDEILKQLVVFISIGIVLLILYIIGLSLFTPNRAVREETFSRILEALGYGLFFTLQFIGMAIVSIPGRFISIRVAKAMSAENEA